jgi:hypothetical protein
MGNINISLTHRITCNNDKYYVNFYTSLLSLMQLRIKKFPPFIKEGILRGLTLLYKRRE